MISFNFQCDCMRQLVSFVLFFRESSRFVETKQAKRSNAGTLTRPLAFTAGTPHCRTAVVWGCVVTDSELEKTVVKLQLSYQCRNLSLIIIGSRFSFCLSNSCNWTYETALSIIGPLLSVDILFVCLLEICLPVISMCWLQFCF